MQAKEVFEKARIILQDAGAVYWPQDELPGWLNDGRGEAYALRPDLYHCVEVASLCEGYVQKVPNGSRRLLEVARNISHPGQRVITLVHERDLSKHRPAWRSMPKASEIVHYMYDEMRSSEFYVYPPARTDVKVEINYAKLPEIITGAQSEQELVQEGEYASALVDFVLFRAFQKEADTVPAFMERAMQHYSKFNAAFTGSVATQAATSPNQG